MNVWSPFAQSSLTQQTYVDLNFYYYFIILNVKELNFINSFIQRQLPLWHINGQHIKSNSMEA